jgi:hypothetical protein
LQPPEKIDDSKIVDEINIDSSKGMGIIKYFGGMNDF